jgi:hypothetical protein
MTLRRARRGINAAAALAVACGVFSFTPRAQGADSISVFDRKGSVGSHTSIALDSAGMPVVVYYDASNQKVKVQVCQSVSCKGKTSEESPASATMGIFQGPTSVAVYSPLGANFPVIAFVTGSGNTLNILRCGNATCSLGNTVTPIDAGLVVYDVSVAVDDSGFPVASYYTGGLGTTGLRVLRCTNATCSGDASILVEAGDVGRFSSLKLDSARNPVITYWDETNKDLVLLHCGNADCTSGNNRAVVDDNDAGEYTSLQLDADNPVISYRSNAGNTLKVARCSDANCTETITISAPDPATNVQYTSLALDAAGNPVVAYYDFFTNNTLKILHCGDNTCSSGNTISMPDRRSGVGTFASLALPASGNPIVAYYDAASANLKLLICDDPGCQ